MQSPDPSEPTPRTAVSVHRSGPLDRVARPAGPVILRDGTSAWLRPTEPGDAGKLRRLFARASTESRALRFFAAKREVSPSYIEDLVTANGDDQLTLVVGRDAGTGEEILGVGSWVRLPQDDEAEVAFFVDDPDQGHGIATLLLDYLAQRARGLGIRTLVADVLLQNQPMLDTFRNSGFPTSTSLEGGVLRVRISDAENERTLSREEDQERSATVASLLPPAPSLGCGRGRFPRPGCRRTCCFPATPSGRFPGACLSRQSRREFHRLRPGLPVAAGSARRG